ncbi:MAG: hypothetical protein NTU41_09795 [Chloroflexi bacterium]|nr:hypothetical protein [Chloroflexota bacterium]
MAEEICETECDPVAAIEGCSKYQHFRHEYLPMKEKRDKRGRQIL